MQNNNKSQVNVLDLFFYLLGQWYWFVLCIALCVGYAYYRYAKAPMIYRSDATVIIKDPSNARSTVSLGNYSGMINRISMSNEMLQLKSKQLMSEVVRALDADINYGYKEKLRTTELYDSSPVRMHVSRELGQPDYLSLHVRCADSGTLQVWSGEDKTQMVALGDTVTISGATLCFTPTINYSRFIGKEITITKVPLMSAAVQFLSRLKIQQAESEATILSISLQDFSLRRANDVLNTLVDKYNEDAIREKNRIAVNTASFINERLMIIQEELNEVEDDIANFKVSEQMMDVNSQAAEYLRATKAYGSKIEEIETKLRLADYLDQYLRDSFKEYQVIPVNTGLEDADINGAIDSYNKLILQRERLIEASSSDSPAVIQTEKALAPLRQNILGYISNLKTSLHLQEDQLQELEQENLRKFTSMPEKARKLISIERQQNIKESLYVFLLNKREENALTQAMVDNNARMIDSAEGSSRPIYPERNKMLLVAFLIGLFVPAVVLLGRLLLDTKLRSRKDLDDAGDMPFLADIPTVHFNRKFRKEHPEGVLVEYGNTTRVFKEAMRMMCTNIDFTKPEGCSTPIIMTSSFNSGVGKSFVCRNVAACMADASKRVIIVDTDLRKRSISDWFKMKHKVTGLSNFLVDKELLVDDIIHENILDGVDFIPAGHVPPNPTELLGRSRMDQLIELLKERYDYIILDGTPVNMVADTMVLSRVADMNLFVLRGGISDRRQLPLVKELCDGNRLKNVSIVLNGTEIRHTYGYSYGYGYGYGYGYYGYGYGYSGYDTPEE